MQKCIIYKYRYISEHILIVLQVICLETDMFLYSCRRDGYEKVLSSVEDIIDRAYISMGYLR